MTNINWILAENCTASEDLEILIKSLDIPLPEVTIEASFYKSPIPSSPGKLARKTMMYTLDTGDSSREVIGFQGEEGDSFYEEDIEKALINLWLKSLDYKSDLNDIKRLDDRLPWKDVEETYYYNSLEPMGTYNLFRVELSLYGGVLRPKIEKGWRIIKVFNKKASFYLIKTPNPIEVISKDDMYHLVKIRKQESLDKFLQELKDKYIGWYVTDITLDSIIISNGKDEASIKSGTFYDSEYDCEREVPLIIGDTTLEVP